MFEARVASTSDTLEHAGVHVSGALGADNSHRSAIHVDLSGDIDDTVWGAEGSLAPGIRDLSIDERGGRVNRCPCAGPSNWEGNGLAGVGWDRDGDLRFDGIDP